ncbi:hypothetical protein WS99_07380 [Burkholderia territorii]|nr:hypothetical protein WS99_07380 [Burkholderia territorii]
MNTGKHNGRCFRICLELRTDNVPQPAIAVNDVDRDMFFVVSQSSWIVFADANSSATFDKFSVLFRIGEFSHRE